MLWLVGGLVLFAVLLLFGIGLVLWVKFSDSMLGYPWRSFGEWVRGLRKKR